MKQFSLFIMLALLAVSCGTKIPYTTAIRDEFSLDAEEKLRQVQFYTSHTIILNQVNKQWGSRWHGVLCYKSINFVLLALYIYIRLWRNHIPQCPKQSAKSNV